MAYRLRYQVFVDFVGDGNNAMQVASAQTAAFTQTNPVAFVPGGNAPTLANFNTALTGAAATPAAGSLAADISTQINTNLAKIQAFATGGN